MRTLAAIIAIFAVFVLVARAAPDPHPSVHYRLCATDSECVHATLWHGMYVVPDSQK